MRKDAHPYLIYIGVCVALLPILLLRDFTPSNELRYLSIADEALRNHALFAFTNHGVPYADKPPLYLWLVMLGKWLLGTHCMAFLSLFSLVPALVIVHVMDRWTASELPADYARAGRVLLLTSAFFLALVVTLRMDMLMCMFIVLSLRSFWRMLTRPEAYRRERWLFPVYVFLAVFSKGPVGILVPLCSTLVFLLLTGRIRQAGRYWGGRTWGILLAGCVLWFGAVYIEGGSGYLHNLLFHQTVDRAVNAFHHEEPFYYYALSVWYVLAPWSLLVMGTVVASLCVRRACSDLQRFFLTVGFTTFVLLSCISSKLDVYLLPSVPFFCYAALLALPRWNGNAWVKAAVAVPAAVFVCVLPAGAVAVASVDELRPWAGVLPYVAAGILTVSGIITLYFLYRAKNGFPKAVCALAAGLLCACFVGGWALPKWNGEIGYGELCERALELSRRQGGEAPEFCTWGISRPENMDVYLHCPVKVLSDEDVATPDSLSEHGVLMIRARDLSRFAGREAVLVPPYAVVILNENNQTK